MAPPAEVTQTDMNFGPSRHSEDRDEKVKPSENGDLERQTSVSGGQLRREDTVRGLKSRHAQMIALGGTIGTGLFVGAGQGLYIGGPAFLLFGYILISIVLFGVATGTGEMSSYLPVPGSSIAYYGKRFVSKSLGFTLGWVYWYTFAITVSAEVTATNLVIQYWNPPLHTGVWITIIAALVIALNCMPVKFYGEIEFWFASIKVFGIVGLLILTIVLFFGGGPSHEPLWFSNWSNPQSVNEYLVEGAVGRLCAFIGVLTFSCYAFVFAPELLVVTGGEMESPRRNLPKATSRYIWRLVIFYVMGVLAITILVGSRNSDLLNGTTGAGSSPWAIGIRDAGIRGLDSVVNVVIVLSAWSAANSYLYLASRTLYGMAVAGDAPAIFARCTKSGIPIYATVASALFCVLSYLNIASTGAVVFNWFVGLINSAGFQSWICCCLIYLRFRKATFAQNITDLPFRSRFQPYLSWFSVVILTILLLLSGFKVFFYGQWNTSTFITSYIGIPIFLVIFIGHKFTVGRDDPWYLAAKDIDLHSGLELVLEAETPLRPRDKWYQKWRVLVE